MSDCPHCDPLQALVQQWAERRNQLEDEIPVLRQQAQDEIDDQAFRLGQAQSNLIAAQVYRASVLNALADLNGRLAAFGAGLASTDISFTAQPGWHEYQAGSLTVWSREALTPDQLQRLVDAAATLVGLQQAIDQLDADLANADANVQAREAEVQQAETTLDQLVAAWQQRFEDHLKEIDQAEQNRERYYQEWLQCLEDCRKPKPPPVADAAMALAEQTAESVRDAEPEKTEAGLEGEPAGAVEGTHVAIATEAEGGAKVEGGTAREGEAEAGTEAGTAESVGLSVPAAVLDAPEPRSGATGTGRKPEAPEPGPTGGTPPPPPPPPGGGPVPPGGGTMARSAPGATTRAPAAARSGPTITVDTNGRGEDSVAKDQPFTVTVEVPRDDPSVDPPETIEVTFKSSTGDEETLTLRWTGNVGGPARYRSNPITIRRGATGGGRVTIAGFEFSTGGMGELDVDNGGTVTVSYGGASTDFKVYTTWVQQGLGRSREVISRHKTFWSHLKRQLEGLPSSPEVDAWRTNADNHLRLIASAERIDRSTRLLDTQKLAYLSAYARLLGEDLSTWDPRDEIDLVSRARREADRLTRESLWRGLTGATIGLYQTVVRATPAASAWTLFTGRDVLNRTVTWDRRVLAALELAGWLTLRGQVSGTLGRLPGIRPPRTVNTVPGRGCFAPGTLVSLGDGRMRAIERLVAGDRVLSFAEAGEHPDQRGAVLSEVRRTYRARASGHLRLALRRGARRAEVRLTPGHRMVGERGYVAAGELRLGDRLLCADGGWAQLSARHFVADDGEVCNLEVAQTHHYCVSALRLVVHNWCETKSTADLNRILDRRSYSFERYRHPSTGRRIHEPGFRNREPINQGNRTAAKARNLKDATFPDAYGTGTWIDGTSQAISWEMKTVQRTETVLGHFRKAKVQSHVLAQHGGRLAHLPPGSKQLLIIDLRLSGQTVREALRDLSKVLREGKFRPDSRRPWDGVAFLVGGKNRPRLAVNPNPLGAGGNPNVFQIP